ncbi:hypothetical protein AVEN_161972-1 [Araneus ventricosus]|uniref:CCHC-type domain-containing protein n=1 Tax=Araneus ventricosus TaxID=182803 RepID=A0A4Y2T2U7_ARAVE|nr:hypothetical protein AVEN_161972-1 [Araneus ventricosus]
MQAVSPNVNAISGNRSDRNEADVAMQATANAFTKSLDIVMKQLESMNARLDEIVKRNNRDWQQRSSQPRNRTARACFNCGRLGRIASICEERERNRQWNENGNGQNFSNGRRPNGRQNINRNSPNE